MPARQTLLATNEIYHVFNRGTGSIPIFKIKKDYLNFINAFSYYQYYPAPIKYSRFKVINSIEKNKILNNLAKEKNLLIDIIAYCLMPNHFHLLLKQNKNKGIENFLRLISNSHSNYFNTKYKRKGGLFEGTFKTVLVENDEQLLHLSRYIHLNPYSSFVVKTIKNTFEYPYSSLKEYLNSKNNKICRNNIVIDQFKNPLEYKKFVIDQANYQRSLDMIKHQLLEV